MMIDHILEQKDAIKQILHADSRTCHLCPTWQDMDVLESLQAGMGPLNDFTDSLSSESCVTVSAVTAVLHILKTNVLAECSDDTPLTSDIKKSILQYINQKYEPDNIKTLLNLASFLDPHFCT